MASFWIVELFDAINYVSPSSFPIGIDFPLNPQLLEELEEALGDSFVITVAASADVSEQVVRLQERMPS